MVDPLHENLPHHVAARARMKREEREKMNPQPPFNPLPTFPPKAETQLPEKKIN